MPEQYFKALLKTDGTQKTYKRPEIRKAIIKDIFLRKCIIGIAYLSQSLMRRPNNSPNPLLE